MTIFRGGPAPTRLFTRPLGIHPEVVNEFLAGEVAPQRMAAKAMGSAPTGGTIAVVPILGGLTYRSVSYWDDTSYTAILSGFRKVLADPSVAAILLDVDSPGGEVAGLPELAEEIFQARGQKPIWAVVNQDALSAAYWLASAADRVLIPSMGRAGSVGVLRVHRDYSGMLEADGVKYTAVHAGARKVDFAPWAPLSDEARDVAQRDVFAAYDLFVRAVARNRGISESDVRKTEAGVFSGQAAVDAGLADAVADWPEAVALVVEHLNTGGEGMSMEDQLKKALEGADRTAAAKALAALGFTVATEAVTPAQVPETQAAALAPAVPAAPATPAQAGLSAKDGMDILELCAVAGVGQDFGKTLAGREGMTLDAAGIEILREKARLAQANPITSTVTPTGTGAVNGVVAEARRRAEAAEKSKQSRR